MATRIYCDHCGNTVKEPMVFSFGPKQYDYEYATQSHPSHQQVSQNQLHLLAQAQAAQNAGYSGGSGGAAGGNGGGAVGVVYAGPAPAGPGPQTSMPNVVHAPEPIPREDVDLCPRCVTTWMARVRNITKVSDV